MFVRKINQQQCIVRPSPHRPSGLTPEIIVGTLTVSQVSRLCRWIDGGKITESARYRVALNARRK